MNKLLGTVLTSALTISLLAGCGTSTSNKKKVGIIQFMDHTSLNEIKDSKIKVVNAEAKVVADDKVLADGEEYCCDEIVVATGSKPRVIKGLEYDHEFILSSDDILAMTKLPKSIVIVGSGAIGIEWARILSAFGVEVSVVELAERLVPLADWEVSKRVERIFKMKKIKTYLSTCVEKIVDKKVVLSNGEELEPECVLVAVGREAVRPDTEFDVECIGDACGEITFSYIR